MSGLFTQTSVRGLAVVLLAALTLAACVQEKKVTNKEIYLYQGQDRQQKLIENAKKEGALAVYTAMTLKDSTEIKDAFERKYGIKVELWRAGGEKVAQRALIEAKAGRYDVDVLEMNGPDLELLYRGKLLEEFYSPHMKDIPAEALPVHKHYVPDRINFFVMAYNTKLIKPEEAPGTFEDLLQAKWRGKIALEPSDVDWFAAVVKGMGEDKGMDYFKKLAVMRPTIRNGHTQLAEVIASGEQPIGINAFMHSVERLKKKESTIEWKVLQPVFGRPSAVGLSKNAPHPHAALLFADFILSKEGQQIIQERGRIPSSTAVENSLINFKYQLVDPGIALDEWDKWGKIWSDLFLGGKPINKEEDR